MDQKIINLFDEYTHKPLTREEFLKRLAKLAGGTTAALALLPLLEVNYAYAATVSPDDDSILTEDITYPVANGQMKGYLAKPKGTKTTGAILVIHENRGLNAHTKDIARRLAVAGYIALAADALSPLGGTPANEDEARGLFAKLDTAQNLDNFVKGVDFLKSYKGSNTKVACIGFCWGGAMANQLAVNSSNLKGAIAFYGRQADAADVPRIKSKLQLHYGEMDERINAGIPAYEEALKKSGVPYEVYVYKGAQHAFLNDTAPTRYNPEAAKLAWERVLTFLKQTIA